MNGVLRAGVASALLVLGACHAAPDTSSAKPRLLPGFADDRAALQSVTIRTAGNIVVATLVRRDGQWRVTERAGWPADPVLVENLLHALGDMRGAEAKTADPALYPRLGVEPVSSADARGVEVRFAPGGKDGRLVVGKTPERGEGSFVRIGNERGSWLADRVLVVPHDTDDWLDHTVVHLPLARVAEVMVAPADAPRFRLVHAAEGFRLLSGTADIVADPEAGEALASLAGPLEFDAVARDDGSPAERNLRLVSEDGFAVSIEAWRRDGDVWMRVRGSVDGMRAQGWAAQSNGKPAGRTAPAKAVALDARCAGYAFRLAAYPASVLMMGRESLQAEAR